MNIDKYYVYFNLFQSFSISMIKASNVDSTDIDVDSLVKSAKVTFTIFLGIWEKPQCLFCDFPVI